MNFLKRAWYAVVRKPSRSIIMLVIFFVVANLVLAGISIQHATTTAEDQARKRLGGAFTLAFDEQAAREKAMTSSDSEGRRQFNITAEPVTEDMALTVAKQKNVISYNIIATTYAMGSSFKPVVVSTTSTASTSSKAASAVSTSVSTAKADTTTGVTAATAKANAAVTQLSTSANGVKVVNTSTELQTLEETASSEPSSSSSQAVTSSQETTSQNPGNSQTGGNGNNNGNTSRPAGNGNNNGESQAQGGWQGGGREGGEGGEGSVQCRDRVITQFIDPNATIPDFTIVGLSSTELYSDFNDGSSTFVSGSQITDADKGKHVVMLEQTLADADSIKVGDTVKIKAPDSDTEISCTVVGIYKTSSATSTGTGMGGLQSMAFSQAYNKIYTDYSTALELKTNAVAAQKDKASNGNARMGFSGSTTEGIDSVIYYIDDPKNMDAALADVKKMDIDWTKFTVTTDTSSYETMVSSIQNVAKTSMIIVYLVAIVGALILARIMLLNVRERMYETGVMLSMGESRWKLLLQFTVEMVVIAAIAFGGSLYTGKSIANYTKNYLISNELNASTTATASTATTGQGGYGQGGYAQGQGGYGQGQGQGNTPGGGNLRSQALDNIRLRGGGVNNNVKPITTLSISISWYEFGFMCLAGLIIILLATIIPAVSIMRFKPKSILTRAG